MPLKSSSAGRSAAQRALACGQRGWKAQPAGGFSGLGTSPCTGVRERPDIAPVAGGDPSFETQCGALKKALADTTLAMTKVSMSWWLSEAVQADLDAQFCDKGNRNGLNDLMQRITRSAN